MMDQPIVVCKVIDLLNKDKHSGEKINPQRSSTTRHDLLTVRKEMALLCAVTHTC